MGDHHDDENDTIRLARAMQGNRDDDDEEHSDLEQRIGRILSGRTIDEKKPTPLESALDRELGALKRCVQILEALPPDARARAAGYLAARFALTYVPPPPEG